MSKCVESSPVFLVLLLLGVAVLTPSLSGSLRATAEEYDGVAALFGLDVGARPAGMGGAFTSLADDENAVYYNPAALAYLEETGTSSAWSPRFGLLNYGSLGVAGKYFGANLSLLSSGPVRIPNNFSVPTDESFIYLSGGGIASVGFPLGSYFSVGGKVKCYYSHVSTDPGSDGLGWSVDPAFMLRFEPLRIGMTFENAISSGIVYGGSHTEELSRVVRAGLSYGLSVRDGTEVNLLAEAEGKLEEVAGGDVTELTPHLGAELWFNQLGLRAGYNGRGGTFGASADFDVFRLDWGFVAYQGDIEGTHIVSLFFRF
ncbi:MAG: hypothetical protein ACOC88_00120 [Candidatus Bipolaricaulota bacterium]